MSKSRLPLDPEALESNAQSFFNSIKAESDRGCVLVAAAFLDEAVELLLRREMSKEPDVIRGSVETLFTGTGPLRSFWAKIELCRALKLIPEDVYQDFGRIRRLRNHFAHSYVDATFGDQKAIDLVAALNYFGTSSVPPTDKEKQQGINYRQRFTLAASWHAGAAHREPSASRQ